MRRRAPLLGAAGRRNTTSGTATRAMRMARIVYSVDPAPTSPTATRYELHCLQGDHVADRARIKAANPAAEIIVYANPTVTRPSDPTGITGCYPASNFPNAWLMHDSGNNIMLRNVGTFSGADWKMVDFSNTAFQAAAVTFLSNKCAVDGWDGVLLDDILPYNQYSTVYPGNIANDTAWATAMTNGIQAIAAGVMANGYTVYGNVSDQFHESFWLSCSANLTGGTQEGWLSVNNGSIVDSLQNGRWTVSMAQATDAEATHQKHFWHVSTSSTATARYALCSLLLVWLGYSRISFAPDQSGSDVWFTEIDQVASLGLPTAPVVIDSTGVRQRQFQGGLVTVNPNETSQTAFGSSWAALSGTLTLGGTGGAAPDPFSVAGLVGWWKADSITGLANAAAVATWADSSSGGNPATQATAANQPTYRTGVVNGKPVVRFDGTNDYLTSPASASRAATTIFAVVRPSNITTVTSTIVGASADGGLQLRLDSGTPTMNKQNVGFVGSATNAVDIASFWIVTATYTDGGTYAFYRNSIATGSGTHAQTMTAGTTLNIGRNGSGNNEFFVGDIAEIVEYSSVLSSTDRATVHGYLSSKYAITLA